ncbi:hypothetical protein Pla110_41410 [Polystyrenella longa]|uniref:Planctomycete cytochrome C n=1 Tax=Polystyrenella longa TaxID=2528007 RepID=A0A518CT43_9PLAN|nr:DUF1592 domain-containing protein [Polystyrenella longa]QDU82386.1 hypothetical protein Pla110_41410 [Polystyrenella longa]
MRLPDLPTSIVTPRLRPTLLFGCFILFSAASIAAAEDSLPFEDLEADFTISIQPLLKTYCNDCHSTDAQEGDLDLERYAGFQHVRQAPAPWQKVIEMLDNGEMPPEESKQLTAEEKKSLLKWVRHYLDTEARSNAGDPGPVVLRRLNNAEYTYTIQDLTGAELNPAEQFPVDGAAGEGFTNTGNSLVMSPSLVTKYFDAAKGIASHVVLLPDGIRFSTGSSRRDFTDETVARIQEIYTRHTGPMGDSHLLDQWNVADTAVLTKDDGRVDLARYFGVLLKHRDSLISGKVNFEEIASAEKVNAKYLQLLGTMLVAPLDDSILLNQLRQRWQTVTPEQGDEIIAEIRAWQQQLWKYNKVGQFGSIRAWQEGVNPISSSRQFRFPLSSEKAGEDLILSLQANNAGDESPDDVVLWHQPRFVRPGQSTLLLSDVRAISILLPELRTETLTKIENYLSAAQEIRNQTATENEQMDVNSLAARHDIDPLLMPGWLSMLGLGGNTLSSQDYLHVAYQDPTRESVKGWGFPEAPALMLLSNPTDDTLRVPGEMLPHSIAVHPRPERWVAVGWQSTIQGSVRVEAEVQDADLGCGNGANWSLELRRGSQREVLQSGTVAGMTAAKVDPITNISLQPGDMISLVIDPRDRDHACDLTRIELKVTELAEEQRSWSLTEDCAATIADGNPHADQHGNLSVWHFYSGMIEENLSDNQYIPRGSLLAKWLGEPDSERAHSLAKQLQQLLNAGPTDATTEEDRQLYSRLHSLNGLLFSQIDYATLALRLPEERANENQFGFNPQEIESTNIQQVTERGDLIVTAPAQLMFRLPADMLQGADFVTAATLQMAQGSVQVQASDQVQTDWENLQPGLPVLLPEGSGTRKQWEASLEEFRDLFPLAMCYPKIVPVDEGISIVLYHREDEHLKRLMLSDEESQRLDQLWSELRYISQDALTSLVVLEQLIQFATQDGEPTLYEPLREPYELRASEYRKWLLETESVHLQALLEFITRAYRRPLTPRETTAIQELYAQFREEEMDHEEAFRLTLARVLTSPAFLYRLEEPGEGLEPTLVSDFELATRLSYFLWSSTPDAELTRLASENRLHEPEVLAAQTRRMLADPKIRRMAIEFGCQWLHIRDFDQHDEKSEAHFPEFATIRKDMYEESILYFTDLFQNDRSILDLIESDYTFLNENLATFYEIPHVTGPDWRRVEGVRQYGRGGILAQATTLSKQSGASRTSAILRGNWVYESLLGERLPRPPQGIPILPETVPASLTERQLIEQHSSVASCAKCHERIDPFGFSLEGFDAIGRRRSVDGGGHAIDTSTTLRDGTEIEGLSGLQQYLGESQRETIVRQFCRKLLGYALGRSVQLSDEPLIDEMMTKLSQNGYRIVTAVDTIIQSEQFHKIRGRDFSPPFEVTDTP